MRVENILHSRLNQVHHKNTCKYSVRPRIWRWPRLERWMPVESILHWHLDQMYGKYEAYASHMSVEKGFNTRVSIHSWVYPISHLYIHTCIYSCTYTYINTYKHTHLHKTRLKCEDNRSECCRLRRLQALSMPCLMRGSRGWGVGFSVICRIEVLGWGLRV